MVKDKRQKSQEKSKNVKGKNRFRDNCFTFRVWRLI